jgi:hypothetical protein
MARFDGSLARKLDFGDADVRPAAPGIRRRADLRLARPAGAAGGPDLYRMLDRRRRRAQIAARHALDLIETRDRAAKRS